MTTRRQLAYRHKAWAVALAAGSLLTGQVLAASSASATTSTVFLSDLAPASAINGWGPAERDRSNGGRAAGDGQVIRLDGSSFKKGLGVHARSALSYRVPQGCTTFAATVGVDDEVGARGSVSFQVHTGNTKAYDSGRRTGGGSNALVSVPVPAGGTVQLIVTDSGDGNAYDHADWANARFICQSSLTITPPSDAPTASMTWRQAWDSADPAVLRNWHESHSGPTVPVTKTVTGMVTVASQADADALVGAHLVGKLRITASNVRLHDFKMTNDGNSSIQNIMVNVLGGKSGIVIEDVEFDGGGYLNTSAVIAGETWSHMTVRRAEFSRHLDAVRGFEGSDYQHLYVHDPLGDPTYTGGDGTKHADAFQVIRSGVGTGGIRLTESWLDHGVTAPNVMSAVFLKTDAGPITDVVVEHNYINGGKAASVLVEDGGKGAPTNVAVRNNRFGRDYQRALWAGAGVNNGAGYDRSGNVWSDTLTPAVLTWGIL